MWFVEGMCAVNLRERGVTDYAVKTVFLRPQTMIESSVSREVQRAEGQARRRPLRGWPEPSRVMEAVFE